MTERNVHKECSKSARRVQAKCTMSLQRAHSESTVCVHGIYAQIAQRVWTPHTTLGNFRVHNIVQLQTPATQKGDAQTTQGDLVPSGIFLLFSLALGKAKRYR